MGAKLRDPFQICVNFDGNQFAVVAYGIHWANVVTYSAADANFLIQICFLFVNFDGLGWTVLFTNSASGAC